MKGLMDNNYHPPPTAHLVNGIVARCGEIPDGAPPMSYKTICDAGRVCHFQLSIISILNGGIPSCSDNGRSLEPAPSYDIREGINTSQEKRRPVVIAGGQRKLWRETIQAGELTGGRTERSRHQATQGTDNAHRAADSTTAAPPRAKANASSWRRSSTSFHLDVVENGSSFLARSQ